jgi:hypothetical protein
MNFATKVVSCAFSLLATACFAQTTVPQHAWQKIQMPTAAQLASAWQSPPAEYGPEPYFGLNGPVTIESVAHDLDTMKSIGFHTVTVQAGFGMKQAYLSPEYFAFFKQFVAEAKKRDLRVWIVDDAGYPSGFAGGKFSSEKPELRMQALAITQRIPVKAGEALSRPIGENAVAALALSSTGERVAISLASGSINWSAPATGDWTVLVVEHVFRTSPTRSDTNPTRLKDSTQSLEDYMNPAATAAYLQFTHQQYYDAMPDDFGTTILGFRGDEPDYSIAGLPWTSAFFDHFQQTKGYDIRPYVAAILASEGGGRARPGTPPLPPPVQLSEAERRAKADYYDVFSQLFAEGFFQQQALWCAAHGVEYQVHLNHEEMEMQLTRSEGDFLRDMKYVEEPGIDAIWHQIWTDTVSDFPRLASSAAHVYGHPRSFTESFAAYRPAPDVTMARYIINEQIVRGINVIETMNFSSTATALAPPPATPTPEQAAAASMPAVDALPATAPTTGAQTAGTSPTDAPRRRGGPSPLMRDPAWPALMDYARRLTYVMSQGRPAASVALYLPSSSMWLGDSASDTAFVSAERLLSERQIDFDIINQNALAEDLTAGPGILTTMSGNSYRTVILPSVAVLTQTELTRLQAFARGGGKVLFLSRTPSIISGKTILDARASTPEDFAFALVETSAQLPATPTPPDQPPASPPAPMVVPAAIETAISKLISTREVTLDTPDSALKVNTRRLKDANVYLFFNEGAAATTHAITLHTAGKSIEAWDPSTGTVSPVASTLNNNAITVKLNLKPYETRLLTVR